METFMNGGNEKTVLLTLTRKTFLGLTSVRHWRRKHSEPQLLSRATMSLTIQCFRITFDLEMGESLLFVSG